MDICRITRCFYSVDVGTLLVLGIILSEVVYMGPAVLIPE
jgi:hypothetical protein